MSTITAGDYTVEFAIGADNYRQWYNTEYRKPNGDFEHDVSPALSLKKHLAEVIGTELTQDMIRSPLHSASAGTEIASAHKKIEGKAEMTKVEVADIVFSFNN
jgi:hypothetical protein